MEFKQYDKVICVKEKEFSKELKLNKQYTVKNVYLFGDESYITIYELPNSSLYSHRFKLLSEIRKQKIKRLRNEI